MTAPSTTCPAASLPPLLLLTDRSQLTDSRTLTEVVADCVDAGLRAVVARERDLEDRERAELVYDLRRVLDPVGGIVVVAAPELGRPDGVHLRRADTAPRDRPALLGRSCHDRDDLARATREGCDYVTLSPVAPSPSKPGHGPPLGADGLEEMTRHPVPSPRGEPSRCPAVYALGGVTPDNAPAWTDAGADGVAVMGAVMRAPDPAAVVADLLAALTPGSRVASASVRLRADDRRPGGTA
jgi:thiamine-phosphate diphosphorylase